MPVLASTVIDFTASYDAAKPPFVYKIEPESLYTGDTFKVTIYAPHQHVLFSPYNGLTTPKATQLNASSFTQTLSIGSLNTDYPIAELTSIVCANEIINKATRAIVYTRGANLSAVIGVVNYALKLLDDSLELVGSVTAKYKTFKGQYWSHSGFKNAGDVMLFAQNETTSEWQEIPLNINTRTANQEGIKIEAWTSQPIRGFSPYHTVIIYPSDKKLKVVADYGTVTKVRKQVNNIKDEQVTFSGKSANTSYPLNELTKFTGIFFDTNGNEIEPVFHANDGLIVSNVDCYGVGYAEYESEGVIYNYDAEIDIDPPPTPATNIRIGNIYAFEKGKIGIAASYTVPAWQNAALQQMDFYTVTRKVLSQETNTFEYPPNWSSGDNTFPHIATGDLPIVGDPSWIIDKVIEAGHVDINGSIDFNSYSNRFYDPYASSPENPDAVYEIQETIPSEITDTYLIDKLNDAINAAKTRWGIV